MVRLVVFLLFFPASAIAANVYTGTVVSVTDGDTIRVYVEIWPGVFVQPAIRLAGIDTPELRGKCAKEKSLAREAQLFIEKTVPVKSRVALKNVKIDKYGGRYNAEVWTDDGRLLSALLIEAGLGRPYHGERRQGWC